MKQKGIESEVLLLSHLPRKYAFVFQENALFPWCSVLENVKLGMVFQGVPKSEQEKRARNVDFARLC